MDSSSSSQTSTPPILPQTKPNPTDPSHPSNSHEDYTTASNLPLSKLEKISHPTSSSGEKIDPSHPLWEELAPGDSYVDGVYWADLPKKERTRWALRQSNEEAKRELGEMGRMMKRDPLSPVAGYFR